MNSEQVMAWVAAYERAWRSPGTGKLDEIFTLDATYSQGPYEQPRVGLAAIAQMWEATRDGPDDVFAMTSAPVAVEGDTAVVRVEVRYGEPLRQEYRNLWVMRFAEDGRCSSFEEWPFFPGQPYTANP
jgi:ketosteroid isomerase-like protein